MDYTLTKGRLEEARGTKSRFREMKQVIFRLFLLTHTHTHTQGTRTVRQRVRDSERLRDTGQIHIHTHYLLNTMICDLDSTLYTCTFRFSTFEYTFVCLCVSLSLSFTWRRNVLNNFRLNDQNSSFNLLKILIFKFSKFQINN